MTDLLNIIEVKSQIISLHEFIFTNSSCEIFDFEIDIPADIKIKYDPHLQGNVEKLYIEMENINKRNILLMNKYDKMHLYFTLCFVYYTNKYAKIPCYKLPMTIEKLNIILCNLTDKGDVIVNDLFTTIIKEGFAQETYRLTTDCSCDELLRYMIDIITPISNMLYNRLMYDL